jgi:hypothetical protein
MKLGSALIRALTSVALTGIVGCSKPSSDSAAASPSASASSSAPMASSSVPSASASAAAARAPVAWAGTYTSTPGSLYVYDGGEWKGVHFRGDDASDGLGTGSLSFTIDPTTRQVHGVGAGPIGDVVITGAVTGDEVSFTALRKDTTDRGLTGTGVGKLSQGALTGTMRLSRGDAHVIREAKFDLSKKAP